MAIKKTVKRGNDDIGQAIAQSSNHSCIESFLQSDECGGLLLLGSSQSGKSTTCRRALESFPHLYVNFETIESHNELVKMMNNYIDLRTISTRGDLDANVKLQRIIYIDDVDILLTQDRYANSFLQTLFDKCKLIMSCTFCEERRVADMKKKCKHVLRIPYANATNATNVSSTTTKCTDVINKMQIRSFEDEKYFNMNIYQIVEKIFDNSDCGIKDMEIAISPDPTLIGFMMYDNYKKIFAQSYLNVPLKVQEIIGNAYMQSTTIEDYGYYTNDSFLISIANMIRCFTIRSVQKTMIRALDHNNEVVGLQSNIIISKPVKPIMQSKPKHEIIYTQISSRSAQHCSVNKKMMKLNELTYSNVAFLSCIEFEAKRKMNVKTELGSICQSYIFNICKQ